MAKNKYLDVFCLQIVNFLPTGDILIIWLQFVNFQTTMSNTAVVTWGKKISSNLHDINVAQNDLRQTLQQSSLYEIHRDKKDQFHISTDSYGQEKVLGCILVTICQFSTHYEQYSSYHMGTKISSNLHDLHYITDAIIMT